MVWCKNNTDQFYKFIVVISYEDREELGEDNIKMDLRKLRYGGGREMELAQEHDSW
jgi:hypothetical protein